MEAVEKIVQFDQEGSAVVKLGKQFSKKEAKVIILIKDDEISEKEWLGLAMNGGAFDFLNDSAEDIYTIEDGDSYKRQNSEI